MTLLKLKPFSSVIFKAGFYFQTHDMNLIMWLFNIV